MSKIKEVDPAPINGGPYGGLGNIDSAPNQQINMPVPKCVTTIQPDGGIQVSFLIEPDVAKRLIRRAGGMQLERYLWENVLYRAVVDHVF